MVGVARGARGRLVERIVVAEGIRIAVETAGGIVEEGHILVPIVAREERSTVAPILQGVIRLIDIDHTTIDSTAELCLRGLIVLGPRGKSPCPLDDLDRGGAAYPTDHRGIGGTMHDKDIVLDPAVPLAPIAHVATERLGGKRRPNLRDIGIELVAVLNRSDLRGLHNDRTERILCDTADLTVGIDSAAELVLPIGDGGGIGLEVAPLHIRIVGTRRHVAIELDAHRILEGIDTGGIDKTNIVGVVRELNNLPTQICIRVRRVVEVGARIAARIVHVQVHRATESDKHTARERLVDINGAVGNGAERGKDIGIAPIARRLVQRIERSGQRRHGDRRSGIGGKVVVHSRTIGALAHNSDIDFAVRKLAVVGQLHREDGIALKANHQADEK